MDLINEKVLDLKKNLKNLKAKGALHVFIGNFITKFVAFFASVFIVRLFNKSDYGILGYVENLFGYIYLFAGLGLTNALFRYIILAKTKEQKYYVYNYIIKRSTIYNIFLTVTAIIIFAFIYPHSDEFYKAKWLLPILIFSLPFHSITDSCVTFFRSIFETKKYAIVSCSIGVTVLIFKYIFSKYFGLKGAFISNVILYTFWALILLILIKKKFFKSITNFIPLTKKKCKEINLYSLQYMVTNSIWAIFMLNDIFLLGKLTGIPSVVAEYKVAYVFPANLALFSSSIGVFVAPYFVKHEQESIWIRKNYKKCLYYSIAIIGLVALILFIWAKPIISLLYGNSYINVVPLMRLLIISAFINNVFRYTNANLLAAMGKIKANMYISISGVILQIILNLILIPIYGYYGIAYTSIIVYTIMAIALSIVFNKSYIQLKNDI